MSKRAQNTLKVGEIMGLFVKIIDELINKNKCRRKENRYIFSQSVLSALKRHGLTTRELRALRDLNIIKCEKDRFVVNERIQGYKDPVRVLVVMKKEYNALRVLYANTKCNERKEVI